MHVARVKSMLWLTAVLATAAAAAALIAAALLPLGDAVPPPPRTVNVTDGAGPRDPAIPPLATFEPAWQAPLRRPLIDAPAAIVAAATQPARPPNLMVRLVGTIIDEDRSRSRGLFLVGVADVKVMSVGDRAGGAVILTIEENAATLSYNDETFTLKREKSPFDPSGGGTEQPAALSPPAESGTVGGS